MKKVIAKTISLIELFRMFPDDESSINYLESIFWKDGVSCSRCKSKEGLTQQKKNKHNYWCKSCRSYFNVKTNTPLENSNIKSQKWVIAIYFFMTARKGISSLQLSKELGITQKSSWFMCQRIRECFRVETKEKLSGVVEIDETYIGGLEKNKHADKKVKNNQGRSTKSKVAVVGIKQRDGQTKAKVFDKVNSLEIQRYLNKNVEKGSILSTDEANFYQPIRNYKKISVNHSAKEYVNGMASTNSIESVWAVLKRGFNGIYHNFSKKHLQRYVDEFTFRLNQGNCKIDTVKRIENIIINFPNKKLTYQNLIK